MILNIEKRYLRVPICRTARMKHLCFYEGEKLVFDADVLLNCTAPDFYMYYDMSRFIGKTLSVKVIPEVALDLEMTDTPEYTESLYSEKYRPAAHYSSSTGWLNDPNGLVFYEGKYHMFHQHNPLGTSWGNMHWAHAVSDDLVHWTQLDEALFPDDFGTMFSGSAIVDEKNITGFKENEHAPLLLYYTAAGNNSYMSHDKPFTQCLAYSTDGGKTFRKYDKNPVIAALGYCERDPKIVYSEQDECYYLIIYLKDNSYSIYSSTDLLNFTLCQEFVLDVDNECPDLYPLDKNGKTYWVVSGAKACYLIGTLEKGRFTPLQAAKKLHFGNCSYAAQTFSDVPESDGRRILISWNGTNIPDSIFNGTFNTPVSLSLGEENGKLCLCAYPVKELESIYEQCESYDLSAPFKAPLKGKAQDIFLEISPKDAQNVSLSLLGFNAVVNTSRGTLEWDEGRSSMPLYMKNGIAIIRIVTDTNAIEIYADKGQAYACITNIADYTLCNLEFSGQAQIKADVYPLKNIWKK